MRRIVVCAAAIGLAGCARAVRHQPADNLSGFTARLSFGAGLRLAVDGAVEDTPAVIVLDVASPLSTVSTSCLSDGRDLHPDRVARVRQLDGTVVDVPETALPPARIGSRRIGSRKVGVVAHQHRCVLSLGADVLSGYAIQFDPERRSVSFSESLARERYLRQAFSPTEEAHVVELTRHPDTDWPLVSARLSQGPAKVTATFIVSSRSQQSMISAEEARATRFEPAGDPLEKSIGIDPGRRLAENFPQFALDALELSPGFGIHRLVLRGDSGWKNPAAAGLLGTDVWGRFHWTIDLRAGIIVLRRPKASSAEGRQLCSSPDGRESEEACFALHTAKLGDSLSAIGVIWRDLPEGGRLHLDPVDSQGQPLQSVCQFGLSFQPGDRGSSMRRDFPWQAMEQAFPECAEVVRRADRFSLALFEEGPLTECQRDCAFVRRRGGRKVLCACASALDDS
jgi:hypothetical protein